MYEKHKILSLIIELGETKDLVSDTLERSNVEDINIAAYNSVRNNESIEKQFQNAYDDNVNAIIKTMEKRFEQHSAPQSFDCVILDFDKMNFNNKSALEELIRIKTENNLISSKIQWGYYPAQNNRPYDDENPNPNNQSNNTYLNYCVDDC